MVYFILAANDDDFNLQSDCFVCTILTHGEEGVVYGTDDKVEVKVLLEPFKGNNCRGLVGKPKIFFIQVSLSLWGMSQNNVFVCLCLMPHNQLKSYEDGAKA